MVKPVTGHTSKMLLVKPVTDYAGNHFKGGFMVKISTLTKIVIIAEKRFAVYRLFKNLFILKSSSSSRV